MTDTTKTKAELLQIFRDGQETGSITEQDLRDFIVTLFNLKDGLTLAPGTNVDAPLTFQVGELLEPPVPGTMEYVGDHWFLTNGSRKVIDMSDGIKLDTTTVVNDNTERLLYSYTLNGGSLHASERLFADVSGSYSNASASDNFSIYVKINGDIVHTITRSGGNVTNAGWKLGMEGTIRSLGVNGSFIDMITFNDGDSIYTEAFETLSPLNTAAEIIYEIFMQWDNAKTLNSFSCTQGTMSFKH